MKAKDTAVSPDQTTATWDAYFDGTWQPAAEVAILVSGPPLLQISGFANDHVLSFLQKLGDYRLLPRRRIDGRPAYTNGVNSIWYQEGSGLWLVGPGKDIGTGTAFMKAKDTAASPDQTTATWDAYFDGTWQPAAEVAISETGQSNVLLQGLPNSICHDSMGSYCKTSSTQGGRPVYNNGDNRSLWYVLSVNTWFVGKRQHAGQARGYLRVEDSAGVPEDIVGKWSCWMDEGERWMSATSVALQTTGPPLLQISGFANDHALSFLLGDYRLLPRRRIDGRPAYTNGVNSIWYQEGSGLWGGQWLVGPGKDIGTGSAFLKAKDAAVSPDQTTATWDAYFDGTWNSCETLKLLTGQHRAVQLRGLVAAHTDKCGEYSRQDDSYGGRSSFLYDVWRMWFHEGEKCWFIGTAGQIGGREGCLFVHDSAEDPSDITCTWFGATANGIGPASTEPKNVFKKVEDDEDVSEGVVAPSCKFSAEVTEMAFGLPGTVANGLASWMGVNDMDLMTLLIKGVDAIKEEFMGGTPEDQANFDYIFNCIAKEELESDGQIRDKDHEGWKFRDFVNAAKQHVSDELQDAHVLALRLYTSSSYTQINNPLRDKSATTSSRQKRPQHPFKVTTWFIADAIKKMRAVEAPEVNEHGKNINKTLWRGLRDMSIADEFKTKGGTELGCMSTTSDIKIAKMYASSRNPLLLQINTTNFLNCGVDISFLSMFPLEQEFLYPPLTYLEYTGETVNADGVRVIQVVPTM
jgi:hypothetical protein